MDSKDSKQCSNKQVEDDKFIIDKQCQEQEHKQVKDDIFTTDKQCHNQIIKSIIQKCEVTEF
jgi:hypothetical protein